MNAQSNLEPWRNCHGMHLAKILTVDPVTGLCGVELRDGSQPVPCFVLQPNASKANGWVWLPQVGDLAAVMFLDGMDNQPVIVGSLYATNDTLHAQNPGDLTLRHQSGSAVVIAADGTVTLTQTSGAFVILRPSGDIEAKHATSNADLLLDANGVTASQGSIKAQIKSAEVLLDANSGGGGAKVEIFPDGHINVTPGGSGVINLGGSVTFIARDGDTTSPPIGPLATHTHTINGSSAKVIAG